MTNSNFCARKMRDISEQAREELKIKEFQSIVDKITTAAKNGLTKISIAPTYESTIIALKDLGFQIKMANYITNYNSGGEDFYTCYEVSWDGE